MGKEQPKPQPQADRVDLRLFNSIVIFDVYVVAREGQTARDALIELINSGQIQPTEIVAREVTSSNSIRSSWTEQAPLVAGDVTDEEFEQLKGIKTAEAHDRFYKKAPKK